VRALGTGLAGDGRPDCVLHGKKRQAKRLIVVLPLTKIFIVVIPNDRPESWVDPRLAIQVSTEGWRNMTR
jgi:hypothetical protein